MVLTMSVVSLALMMLSLAVPATAASAYSMLAIIETESRGPLDCGNRARGFEGTDVLYGLSDELAAPGTDTMTGGQPRLAPSSFASRSTAARLRSSWRWWAASASPGWRSSCSTTRECTSSRSDWRTSV